MPLGLNMQRVLRRYIRSLLTTKIPPEVRWPRGQKLCHVTSSPMSLCHLARAEYNKTKMISLLTKYLPRTRHPQQLRHKRSNLPSGISTQIQISTEGKNMTAMACDIPVDYLRRATLWANVDPPAPGSVVVRNSNLQPILLANAKTIPKHWLIHPPDRLPFSSRNSFFFWLCGPYFWRCHHPFGSISIQDGCFRIVYSIKIAL